MKEVVSKISLKNIFKNRKRQLIASLVKKEMEENFKKGYSRIAGFSFDMMLSSINIYGLYEKEYLETLILWLSENNLIRDCALDVGANIGNHSVFFAKYYKEVLSFEPNPLIFKVLNINAEINAGTIHCFPLGVSDSSRQVKFQTPRRTHMSSSRIVENASEDFIFVDLISLDEHEKAKNIKVGLLKIDVEGHEFEVLNGAKNLIEAHHPVILFEQKKKDFKNGSSPCIEFLKKYDYTFYMLKYIPERSNHLGRFKRILNFTLSLLFGSRLKVVRESKFAPANYNFIIAVNPTIK
jgi:FkbM family methyltransferase